MDNFTILIIDDQLYVRKSIQELLQILYPDATVLVAEDDDEALALVREHKPHFITLDLTMPGLGGQKLCTVILDLSPNSHLYVMSALDSMAIKKEMFEKGARGFISKPVSLGRLKDIADSIQESF
ncbi:response regulator [bacterium]|nr:response regulator [bacterium]